MSFFLSQARICCEMSSRMLLLNDTYGQLFDQCRRAPRSSASTQFYVCQISSMVMTNLWLNPSCTSCEASRWQFFYFDWRCYTLKGRSGFFVKSRIFHSFINMLETFLVFNSGDGRKPRNSQDWVQEVFFNEKPIENSP